MKEARALVLALVVASAAAGQETPAAKMEMNPPVRYGFAGIRLALPKSFPPAQVEDPSDVVRGVRMEREAAAVAITVSAWPQRGNATLAAFIEAVQPRDDFARPKNLALRNFKVIKTQPARLAGLEGEVRIMSYTFRGEEITAVRLYCLRPLPPESLPQGRPAMKMGYALTVEAARAYGKELLPVLAAVAGTVELFDPVNPSGEKMELAESPYPVRNLGFSIRPPAGWKLVVEPQSVRLFQTDYLEGGMPVPMARFYAGPAGGTPEKLVAQALDVIKTNMNAQKQDLKMLGQGPASMGGREGYEAFARGEPMPGEPATLAMIVGQRIIVAGEKGYSLMVLMHTENLEQAKAATNLLASGFALLEAPASGPATAPGAETMPSTGPSTTAPAAAAAMAPTPTALPAPTTAPAPAPVPASAPAAIPGSVLYDWNSNWTGTTASAPATSPRRDPLRPGASAQPMRISPAR